MFLCAAAAPACNVRQTASTPTSSISIGSSLPLALDRGHLPLWVDVAVREPLVNIGWDGRPIGRIAERWETSPDGRALRLYLRPDVYFHNGALLTPELAAEIVRRRIKEDGFSFATVTTVEAEKGALVFRTEAPDSFLLTDLAELNISPVGLPLVGTGPFTLEKSGSIITVRAFEKYHRGRPSLDRVEYRSYQTQRSVWAAMMRGEIDAVHELSRDAVEFVEAESTVRTYSFLRPYYTLLGFNVKHPVLQNPRVRRALNLAIDREALIKEAMRGRGQAAKGPIWPHHWAYTSAAQSYTHNPEVARLLLDSEGYRAGREQRPGRMPSRFSFACLLWAADPRFERHAIVVQKQLYSIGVDMEIMPVDSAEWRRRLGSGDFDAFLSEQASGRSLAWPYVFWHSPPPGTPGFLKSGYNSADAVLDRMRRALRDEETRAAIHDLQRVLYDDPPAVFLAYGEGSRAVRNEFVVPPGTAPDIMGSLWQWRRGSADTAQR